MSGSANLPLHFNRDRTERVLDARLDELIEKLKKNRPSDDPWLVRRACEIAAERHRDQLRRSGDPYLTHLLEVAHILADMRMDATTLSAALLHDVIEDTEFPLSRIQERFGDETARLVEGVTKIGRLNMLAPEARQAENVRKMVLAMVNDVRSVVVKLADRLHNMRTIQYLEPEKQQRIARETLEIYSPIAHRLGMGIIRNELEDLFFRVLRSICAPFSIWSRKSNSVSPAKPWKFILPSPIASAWELFAMNSKTCPSVFSSRKHYLLYRRKSATSSLCTKNSLKKFKPRSVPNLLKMAFRRSWKPA